MGKEDAPRPSRRQVEAILGRHVEELMSLPNVLGVGVGRGRGGFLIQVLVSHKVPLGELQPGERIPGSLEGCPVEVAETGGPIVAGGEAAAGGGVGKDG